ncbi:ATP-binding protein [Rhizobium leguminosarum]|uniref:ATP-binding protein n=1 Tax=Rhizobium leguminosarum TaxID=384 RepID=UPI003F945413
MATFSVDTKLFRELGELLVGRESTALIELIKNSYDADATEVAIFAENLTDPSRGTIVVADNGIGMDEAEFSRGFLRIAGRGKVTDDRRSAWFRRRYTGEKGVGRLAAHKLARSLNVTSWRWNRSERDPVVGFASEQRIEANIDWDIIEDLETLDEIDGSGAVSLNVTEDPQHSAGTRLTLSPLRKAWTDQDLANFFDEIATLTPPPVLTEPFSASVTETPLILEQAQVRDTLRAGDFRVHFGGELTLREGELAAPAESADWVIEIDCDRDARLLRIGVAPTNRTTAKYENAEGHVIDIPFEPDWPQVSFQARIFQREGVWPKRYRGVRVYYEGFRVLPYGQRPDDWLDLDDEYRTRGRGELGRLRNQNAWGLPAGMENEGLVTQGNASFFGGVLLTRTGADALQMLVNREGFLPSPQFDFIADKVRLAIDMQVRLRYAATAQIKQARRASGVQQSRAADGAAGGETASSFQLKKLQGMAIETLQTARIALVAGQSERALSQISEIEDTLRSASEITEEAASEATMFRVVASVGLEHAAFVHEVRSLMLGAQTVALTLERIAVEVIDQRLALRLKAVAADAREIRDRLNRNAIYLSDISGLEGRRRRTRQILRQRLERVLDYFSSSIRSRSQTIDVAVSEDITTPPLFPAEITAILSNVISNAVKFSGDHGEIRISATDTERSLRIRVENTGASVELETSERWFQPFRSTTLNVDETLGQGMGLGLTITRSLIDEYGGTIRFCPPSPGYSTAIEIELPRR